MARIFVNYRRDDAPGYAMRLAEELAMHFGPESVFRDVDRIHAGADFTEGIEHAVRSSDVLLVLVGRSWLERDASGRRRIDDPNDVVRLEIAAALESDIRVIPVLVGGAKMPSRDDLPPELSPLARRHSLEIRDATWRSDLDRLVRSLESLYALAEKAAPAEDAPSRTDPRESLHWDVREPESLSSMLLNAALAGVVPVSAFAEPWPEGPGDIDWKEYGTEPSRPPRHEPEPEPPPRPSVQEPELAPRGLARGGWWSWRVAVPLVLFGAGAAVLAKWLLGSIVPVESADASGDTVVCTVFAPGSAAPRDSILVQVFAHLPEQAAEARAIALELDTDARRRTFRSLESSVPPGSRLHFELRMPGLEVDDPVASLVWRRKAEAVQFGVRIPPDAPDGAVIGTLEITLDSAPVGQIKFKLTVDRHAGIGPGEPQGESARRYKAAFISYASKDRAKVLARVQMLSAVGVRYFQDVLSLEPGDRWAKKLELGIDECDLFLLFWSSEAKRSEWVRKEVGYALARRGPDELSPPEIRPVMLEGPPIVKPWDELAHLHFNDRLLYFMQPPDET